MHAAQQPLLSPSSDCTSAIQVNNNVDGELHALINERRGLATSELSTLQRKRLRVSLGKRIQQLVRRRIMLRKAAKIQSLLSDFRGLNQLPFVITGKRSGRICEIRGSDGSLSNTQSDIAEVFALFYEELYKCRDAAQSSRTDDAKHSTVIPPFTIEDLRSSLRQMSIGKAADCSGVVAEMLKVDCPVLHPLILDFFNDLLKSTLQVPSEWLSTSLVVIFKKGGATLPSSYRPVAILDIL